MTGIREVITADELLKVLVGIPNTVEFYADWARRKHRPGRGQLPTLSLNEAERPQIFG